MLVGQLKVASGEGGEEGGGWKGERCLIILPQIVLLSAMLSQDQTTASRIEPSLNRRNSDFSPQNARKDGACQDKKITTSENASCAV